MSLNRTFLVAAVPFMWITCASAQTGAQTANVPRQVDDLLPSLLSTGPIGPPPANAPTNVAAPPFAGPPPVNPPFPTDSSLSDSVNSFLTVNAELVHQAGDAVKDQTVDAVQKYVADAFPGVPGKVIRNFTLDPATAALEIGQGISYAAGQTVSSDIFQNSLPMFLQSEVPGEFLMDTLPGFLGSAVVGASVGQVFSTTSTAPMVMDQVFGANGNYDELAQQEQSAQQANKQMEQQYQLYLNSLPQSQKVLGQMPTASAPELRAAPVQALSRPSKSASRPCLGPGSCGVP
jgi:hypothetical protein